MGLWATGVAYFSNHVRSGPHMALREIWLSDMNRRVVLKTIRINKMLSTCRTILCHYSDSKRSFSVNCIFNHPLLYDNESFLDIWLNPNKNISPVDTVCDLLKLGYHKYHMCKPSVKFIIVLLFFAISGSYSETRRSLILP